MGSNQFVNYPGQLLNDNNTYKVIFCQKATAWILMKNTNLIFCVIYLLNMDKLNIKYYDLLRYAQVLILSGVGWV